MSEEPWWVNWLPGEVINLERMMLLCSAAGAWVCSPTPCLETRGAGEREVPVSRNLGFLMEVRWCERPSPIARAGKPGHKPQLIRKHAGEEQQGRRNL